MPNKQYKYFAFISYSHTDTKEAKHLQRLLERYNLPAKIRRSHNIEAPKKLHVFRDRDELTGGMLNQELRKNLDDSKYLIVICSPSSARSKYVGEEISWFKDSGRGENIIPFIVKGSPHSDEEECFNPMLNIDGDDILGIDVQTESGAFYWLRFHKAFIRLVSRMFDLNFSVLWDRRKIYFYKLYTLWAVISLMIISLIVLSFRLASFDARIHFNAQRSELPTNILKTDTLKVLINGNTHKLFLTEITKPLLMNDIPGSNKGKECTIQGNIYGFHPVDTTLVLDKDNVITLVHNLPVYGDIRYIFIDDSNDEPLSEANVDFGFSNFQTDKNGLLNLMVPIEQQQRSYNIKVQYNGEDYTLPNDGSKSFEITSIYPSSEPLMIYLVKSN